ncbi:TrgA family protein [Rubellimicrobium rubrum]|uniref:TrgA family protein n=1 Tax=Rubellimicrobium rubrum TaxID=2585369 RepID=A0A5C4N426_9RHOB|nr:TrgA family protein [Rubellimicrobium rubrum]TNC52725.1 TrgA family protein [Rubellimicrobium rubrum]
MPTSAKLAAAVLFGVLAWFVSELVKPLFPESSGLGRFSEYNALIGLVIGWRIWGRRARTTWANAVAYGLTSALATTLVTLFLHSLGRMVAQSFRRVYDGPMEALVDVAQLMIKNGQMILTQEVVVTLLVGGVLGGLATEWVARNYS